MFVTIATVVVSYPETTTANAVVKNSTPTITNAGVKI